MGNDFSSPLDASGTSSGLSATSKFRKRQQEQEAEQKANMFFLSDILGLFDDDLDESEVTQSLKPRCSRDVNVQSRGSALKPSTALGISSH
jgi:hypothetical protein